MDVEAEARNGNVSFYQCVVSKVSLNPFEYFTAVKLSVNTVLYIIKEQRYNQVKIVTKTLQLLHSQPHHHFKADCPEISNSALFL